jgi:glycosyltransferase involved in cell wall biosynthesis
MEPRGFPSSGVSVRLAYLCNLYPAVSHSFVRREIAAVEAQGHIVHRFSIRAAPWDLRDEADLAEAKRVEAVLPQGIGRLSLAAMGLLLTRPGKTIAALAMAIRLSSPGLKQKAKHAAYFLEAAWLARRLERLKVEHLHAHFGTNPAAVALIVRTLGGPPYSFTVHGPDEFDAPVALSLGRKIEGAAFVVAISSYGRSQLMRWTAPRRWDRIEVVRCGVDEAFLDADPQPMPPGSTEFVCVARLAPQKGLPLLIAACDQLHSAGDRFSMTIIGGGELRESIEKEISQRGLGDVVRLAGIRSSSEIHEALLRSRAFVLPSFAEGLPVVLMEALALSRPVIATAIAGIPELVDGDCGWLITAGSEEALVAAMKQALDSKDEALAEKGAVGRQRVHEMHDAAKNAELLIEAIVRKKLP